VRKLLIANRGEVAVRIARSARDLGIATVAVYADDDAGALHVRAADAAVALGRSGAGAYLDIARIVAAGRDQGCDAVHPGYGFLSENAEFARSCEAGGLTFVGPRPETLEVLGDKAAARGLAARLGAPLLTGFERAVTLAEAEAFFDAQDGAPVMLKALAGGGGRGMRPVWRREELAPAFERCAREAAQAFSGEGLYVEAMLPHARHIEVQVIGDGRGGVAHLWDRECSLQRQRQKLIEVAPAFGLAPQTRAAMLDAAVAMARALDYRGLGTFEFLVDARPGRESEFVFMEANPRLQVEHTVTEEVLGLDLVAAQLRIATGAQLHELGLDQTQVPTPRGVAVQLRVNAETLDVDGAPRAVSGVIGAYEPPTGPGVRVDGAGFAGLAINPRYDPLLAKVIVSASNLAGAVARGRRALDEFRIEGASTNRAFLQALLNSAALEGGELHTRYVEEHLDGLLAQCMEPDETAAEASDSDDPLAVLRARAGERAASSRARRGRASPPPGSEPVASTIQGVVASLAVAAGDTVRRGQPVAAVEALKMEHQIPAPASGVVRQVDVEVGDEVAEGEALVHVEPAEIEGAEELEAVAIDLGAVRPDLERVLRLHELTGDAARHQAAAKRHSQGKRTARENVADLCDPDSFLEYGPLVTPARRRGETEEQLSARLLKAPADGIVAGVGAINGELVGPERARCVVMSYDYSVLAGTQGTKSHVKTDRMLELAERHRLPLVFFTEGGGGRMGGAPGDPPPPPTTTGGLKVGTWRMLGKLSGQAPIVGIASGRCFAGNAVVLALCDVIIATEDTTLGVGGPAMIEGGGLGVYAPEEVGPVAIQEPNGVIDVVVADEVEAVAVAKQYLSYFQGRVADWSAPDQRLLRHLVPENRRATYDLRKVISTLADAGSVLELRPRFGKAMVTALARIEGRPVGIVANNNSSPTGGAVDADAADKAARFMQLCDGFGIPLVSLIDVPGNMVGPEAEKTATLRHCGRLYVTGANLSSPLFSVVLRKAYGLGALAMSGGSFDAPFFTVSWPTGEFAGMGIEGSIKLGRRAELKAIEDIPARKARYEELVASAYDWASAVNGATVFEFDDVIDPADTRRWLVAGLQATDAARVRPHNRRPFIDTW
jgi:acetyl/propionyl-CoA carboxylase alpha subunit/acetyl-CoA carboxylase carboxyltransferase component